MASLFNAPAGPLLPKARTNIVGLDELTGGVLPGGRPVLVAGGAGSGQIREFVLTGHGVQLGDVYTGPAGVMTGAARRAQEDRERRDQRQHKEDATRRVQELRGPIAERQAQLAARQDELALEDAKLEPIADREEPLAADAQAAWFDMGTQRRADPGEYGKEEQR
jgi:circadian clock protein KaiC